MEIVLSILFSWSIFYLASMVGSNMFILLLRHPLLGSVVVVVSFLADVMITFTITV